MEDKPETEKTVVKSMPDKGLALKIYKDLSFLKMFPFKIMYRCVDVSLNMNVSARGSQKRVLYPLKLELLAVVSCPCGC